MKNLEQVYTKIEEYLLKNFGNKHLVLDNSISYNDTDADVWGFHKIVILVKEENGSIHYKPFFQTTNKK
jgi:hypothetical protein